MDKQDFNAEKIDKTGRSKMRKIEDLCICDIVDDKIWDLSILPKTADIGSVLKILTNSNHVWIVNNLEKKRIQGIFTEMDLLRIIKPKPKIHLSAVSSRWKGYFEFDEKAYPYADTTYLSVKETDAVLDVMDLMTLHDKFISAVVDDKNHLLGEISFKRILQIYMKMNVR